MTTHLVWSNEHRGWWRANGAGYTSSIWDERLGRYTADEAAHCATRCDDRKAATGERQG